MSKKNMKNLSAPRLLRLAMAGSHMSYCPHIGDSTPGYECLCWKNEVRKWNSRVKIASAGRTRSPRAQKIHLAGYKCSAKAAVTFSSTGNITCKQCLAHSLKPVKPIKMAGQKAKIVGIPAHGIKKNKMLSKISHLTPTSITP